MISRAWCRPLGAFTAFLASMVIWSVHDEAKSEKNPPAQSIPSNIDSSDEPPTDYVPPPMGAPAGRVGAATRAPQSGPLTALAPDRGGFTARDAPSLYWWLKSSFSGKRRIAIWAHGDERPILVIQDAVRAERGLRSVDLADFGLRLAKDVVYRWEVVLTADNGAPLASAGSFVERRPLAAESPNLADAKAARELALRGYWYDALAAVADDPDKRTALLAQFGLQVD